MTSNPLLLSAELLLAGSGVFPSKRLTPADASAAERLPKDWAARIRAWLDGSKAKVPRAKQVAYLATWKRLNTLHDDADIILGVENSELGAAYVAGLGRARDYLRTQWRPLRQPTFTGVRLLEPSVSEVQRASAIAAIVYSPGTILDALASNSLEGIQLDAFRAVYPEMNSMLRDIIQDEVFRRQTARKTYELPYAAEQAIRAFLGLPAGQAMQTVTPETKKSGGTPKLDITIKSAPLKSRADTLSSSDK